MRAIIIQDTDCQALVDKLQLVNLLRDNPNFEKPGQPLTKEQFHRLFHYEVVSWLQKQGWRSH